MTKNEIKEKIVEIFKKRNKWFSQDRINITPFKSDLSITVDTTGADVNYKIMCELSELLQTDDIDINSDHYVYDSCSGDIHELIIKTKLDCEL